MDEIQPAYYAYLLRIWRESLDGQWRATLEDPRTGEVTGFATLQQLFAFLDERAPNNEENSAR